MAGSPVSGTEGRVQLNALNLNLDSWSVDDHADDIESTNFESVNTNPAAGDVGVTYEEGITGKVGADVKFSGFWDAGQNPFVNPPNLKRGQIVGPLSLFVRKTGNRAYVFTNIRVLRCSVKAAAKGGFIPVEFTGKTTGAWLYPV